MKLRTLAACPLLCLGVAIGAAQATEPAHKPAATGPETSYVVKPGDTLTGIAKALLREGERAANWQALARHNALKDPNRLEPGSTLRIPAAWLRSQPAAVRVLSVAGDVRAGERALKAGDAVAEGEELRSGPNSHATLEFADRSVLRVRPNSQVLVEAHRAAPSLQEFETRLRLGAGAMEAAVAKQRAPNFRVVAPTGNLAVRGTEFRARADVRTMQTEVIEGRVAASGAAGREVFVDAGFGTVVRAGEAPAQPVKLLGAPDLSRAAESQERPVVRLAFAPLEGATSYRAVIATDRELREVISETVVRRPDLRIVELRDGEYHYGVRGVDALGLEGREARARFQLKARPLPPVPLAPLGAAPLTPGPVEFTWESAPEAGSFRFQLSSDARFGTLILDRSGLTERRVLAEKLEPGRYYWRVASTRPNGDPGPFGDALPFAVQAPTPPPSQ